MPSHRPAQAIAAVLFASLALAGCKKDAAPPPAPAPQATPAPTTAPATAAITAVDLGSTVDTDGKVVATTSTFAPMDPITVTVMTATSDPAASVTGTLGTRWTYQDGQLVNEESKPFNLTGTGISNFTIRKPDGWPLGSYKLEVSLDGKVIETREFTVQ